MKYKIIIIIARRKDEYNHNKKILWFIKILVLNNNTKILMRE